MTVIEAPPRTRYVGRSLPMRGAEEVVTGTMQYLTDLQLPDMLHGKVVRSPIPHGRIRRIDTSRAREVPGVVAILTAADVPENVCGPVVADQPVLAESRVRQVGDPIALVAAETPAAARRAASLVDIELEPLPTIGDPEFALSPDAPSLHPGGNLLVALEHEKGEVEAALERAAIVIDRTVRTPAQEHVCLEPGGGVARYEDGRYTIWFGSQVPDSQVAEIARALKVDPALIRMISTPMGGAFGSKADGPLPIHLALLAKETGRPVRIALTREEVMVTGAKRHPFTITTRLGLDADGRIVALDTSALVDTGPYASFGVVVLKVAAELTTGPYRVPNARFIGRVAYTNNANAGAFRGYGVPQVAFALESALDEAATRLGIGPDELRRRNVLHQGDEQGIYGHVVQGTLRAREALEAVAAHPWWRDRHAWKQTERPPWRRGTGIAIAMKGVGKGSGRDDHAGAVLEIDAEGKVTIWAGPNHSGQFIETTYAQIAADTLDMAYEDITVLVGDTHRVPESGAAAASRSTYAGGSAVRLACERLLDLVADLDLPEPIDWAEAGRRLAARGQARVEATARLADIDELGRIPSWEDVERLSPHRVYGSAAQVVRLSVNERTGEVRPEGVVTAVDCGVAINPAGVIGQTTGGVAQGLGFALMEEYRLRDGVPENASLETYLVPTIRDVPPMETILVESEEETGPFGAKGMAEVVLVPVAPAVTAALRDALGIDVRRLPATPERVLRLVKEETV